MKRISILLFTLAIVLIAADGVEAKTKARKSNGSAVPSVQAVMNQIHKLWDNTDHIQTVPDIDLLAKKYHDGYPEAVVFGKNANIIFDDYYGCQEFTKHINH